jgi:hypothetical protein
MKDPLEALPSVAPLDDGLEDPEPVIAEPEQQPAEGRAGEAAGDKVEPEPTPDQLRALREENRRLRASHEALKEDHEMLLEEFQRDERGERPRRRPAVVPDDGVPRLSPEDIEQIQQSPILARALGVMARAHEQAIGRIESRLEDVVDRVKSRGIPLADEGAVDRLMESGEFRSRRAAHLALLGLRARKAQQQSQRREPADPARPAAERPAVATTRRGLTPARRAAQGVVTLDEHRRKMDREDPGFDPEYVKRYRAGQIQVARRNR